MVNEAKLEIDAERRERVQSEETMLQLLEQTCSQIAAQRAKEQMRDNQVGQKVRMMRASGNMPAAALASAQYQAKDSSSIQSIKRIQSVSPKNKIQNMN